jgi:glycosyltransferase involved in cell wall biosynthesis
MTILHLISHPVQYYTPLYARMAAEKGVDFRVLFCSKKGLERAIDVEFGVDIQWDVPLLDGYCYQFLKNYAWKESLDGFFGLLNWDVIKEMRQAPKDSVVWIHGWNYATHLVTLFAAKYYGHRVFMRGDNAAVIENSLPDSLKKRFKKRWLGGVIFPFIDTFLAVGKQNKAFFELMGVAENRITFAPHAIDNQRFMTFAAQKKSDKNAIRQSLGIPLSKKVIVCSGKYIDKKRPLDLLKAVTLLPNPDAVFLVFVGDGNLRSEMEQFIIDHNLRENVLLTGFVNQSQMPNYYLAADIYAMCSGLHETWGLSTNEAMCFGLPLILADLVGCADDLVRKNGAIYPSGDCAKLAENINCLINLSDAEFGEIGQQSLKIIQDYSYEYIVKSIKEAALK